MNIFNFSYRKVGGLHHWKLGRFGGSFYMTREFRALTVRPLPVPDTCRPAACDCADGWPCPEYRSNNPTPYSARHPE